VADHDRSRACSISNSLGECTPYHEVEGLLEDSRVDAVAVATPPGEHTRPAIATLRANKHLLVEKPLTLEIDDGLQMIAAAKAASTIAVVGFNLRHHRLVQRARQLVRDGALGRVQLIRTNWGSSSPRNRATGHWRSSAVRGSSALVDLGTHHIDLCRFLLDDDFESARVEEKSIRGEADTAIFAGRTGRGVRVDSTFSLCAATANEVTISGDAGTLSFSLYRGGSFRCIGGDDKEPGRSVFRELGKRIRAGLSGGDYLLSYQQQWRAFVAAINGTAPPACSLGDGLAVMRVIESARASSSSTRSAPVVSK
jgi:predicted dehydrogenase